MSEMRALRRAAFDSRFIERHPLLWPLQLAAAPFAGARGWPPVAEWSAAFATAPPVQFVAATPRPRRRPRRLDAEQLYDARIVQSGVVPSRPQHWHDFLNALVWATFPRAKAALHARQHLALSRRLTAGATRLPDRRTRELDALAMLDEGGVIALDSGAARALLVFGHAIYEGLVLGGPALTARVVSLPVKTLAPATIEVADDAVAALLADPARVTHPDELPRIFVPNDACDEWAPRA